MDFMMLMKFWRSHTYVVYVSTDCVFYKLFYYTIWNKWGTLIDGLRWWTEGEVNVFFFVFFRPVGGSTVPTGVGRKLRFLEEVGTAPEALSSITPPSLGPSPLFSTRISRGRFFNGGSYLGRGQVKNDSVAGKPRKRRGPPQHKQSYFNAWPIFRQHSSSP